jgi:hypothetical protein
MISINGFFVIQSSYQKRSGQSDRDSVYQIFWQWPYLAVSFVEWIRIRDISIETPFQWAQLVEHMCSIPPRHSHPMAIRTFGDVQWGKNQWVLGLFSLFKWSFRGFLPVPGALLGREPGGQCQASSSHFSPVSQYLCWCQYWEIKSWRLGDTTRTMTMVEARSTVWAHEQFPLFGGTYVGFFFWGTPRIWRVQCGFAWK